MGEIIHFSAAGAAVKAKALVFALELLDPDIAMYAISESDFKNIMLAFQEVHVSVQQLADFIGHPTSEVRLWVSGEVIPSNPLRSIVLCAVDIVVKHKHNIAA